MIGARLSRPNGRPRISGISPRSERATSASRPRRRAGKRAANGAAQPEGRHKREASQLLISGSVTVNVAERGGGTGSAGGCGGGLGGLLPGLAG
ncbi:hypothetical protein [Nocardia sp. bgisy134]|uniref:hypothetical protein n=1 Tax=unclassified Nocardia TaxID=2637762 RepID=UPI003D735665